MTQTDYEQKKRECWEEFWDEISGNIDFAPGVDDRMKEHIYDTFDRAYTLGKQEIKQEIKQETDAEGEELLTVSAITVREMYAANERIKNDASDNELGRTSGHINHVLRCLFGSKCLPDVEPKPTEPKPAEPFKVGGKVKVYKIGDVFNGAIGEIIDVSNYGTCYVLFPHAQAWFKISDLEPYTEPKEDKHFDDIIKDSFSKERRLNIAKDFASVLLGRLNYDPFTAQINCCCSDGAAVNPYINIARIALSVADALITEALKGDAK